MIKFKQKQYTLQEGHYTGPKDLEEVPSALKVIGGATLAGLTAGYAADKITKDPRKPVLGDEPTSWATRGAQAGFVAGVMGKLLLNTMHNPLSSIKFQELDNAIRKEFGMYRVSGVTVGDTLENRKKMKESFVINSKELTKFKINISVAKGKLVMYTLGLTKKDEDELNDILDYYCKKYYGMEYTSFPIGKGLRSGSWSIDIKFTNHQVAANFIVETGKTLGTQINILDNDISEDIEKLFSDNSAPFLDKTELLNIFSKGLISLITRRVPKKSDALLGMILDGVSKLAETEKRRLGLENISIKKLGPKYLEDALRRLSSRGQWTVGENTSDLNIYLLDGTLLVTVSNGSRQEAMLRKIQGLTETKKKDRSCATLYTYRVKSTGDLDVMLKKLLPLKPNVYLSRW